MMYPGADFGCVFCHAEDPPGHLIRDSRLSLVDLDPDPDPAAGACDNDADIAAMESVSDVEAVMSDCAFACLGDTAECRNDCVQTGLGTSDACSVCFGDVLACTLENCAFQCLDATSGACASCQETNCTPTFEECSGIAQP